MVTLPAAGLEPRALQPSAGGASPSNAMFAENPCKSSLPPEGSYRGVAGTVGSRQGTPPRSGRESPRPETVTLSTGQALLVRAMALSGEAPERASLLTVTRAVRRSSPWWQASSCSLYSSTLALCTSSSLSSWPSRASPAPALSPSRSSGEARCALPGRARGPHTSTEYCAPLHRPPLVVPLL